MEANQIACCTAWNFGDLVDCILIRMGILNFDLVDACVAAYSIKIDYLIEVESN